MILEGLVTTLNPDHTGHLAPMGPHVPGPEFTVFTLKPWKSSQTYKNLKQHPEGVLHLTDDALLIARAAVGAVAEFPPHFDAITVQGIVLEHSCRFFEFRVRRFDDNTDRADIHCDIFYSASQRDFVGFNRGKHAVLEAAILATRFHLKTREEIESEYRRLRIIVDKCGGPPERDAMSLLENEWAKICGGTP